MTAGDSLRRREPLYRQIQATIRRHIATNGLRPGDPLPSEGDLARDLGVGRNSVREAVKALEVLGVVEARSGTGLFVREFSFDPLIESIDFEVLAGADDIASLVEVRLVLETGTTNRMIAGITDDALHELDSILETWGRSAANGLYPVELDRQFHGILANSAGNPILAKLSEIFWQASTAAIDAGVLVAPRNPVRTYEVHKPVVQALRERDPEALEAALRTHYEGVFSRISTITK